MGILLCGRRALGVGVAVVMLAGCGGAQSGAVPTGATPQGRAHPVPGSWMLPGSSSGDLLYVGNVYNSSGFPNVYVFSYPSDKLVGTLSGFQNPQGLCADKSGNVFITDVTASAIVEYAHGGTSPIQTLSDADQPMSCAVDAKTSKLAVGNSDNTVYVYAKEKGTPKTYTIPFRADFATYDNAGNLFIDGFGNPFKLVELPKGGSVFQNITLQGHTRDFSPAGLQWNNGELVFGSANPEQYGCCGKFYRFKIMGTIGEQVGKHVIRGSLANFVIVGSTVIVTAKGRDIYFYDYPSGKSPGAIQEPQYSAYGVAISVAPSGSHRK
jgi:hypothetical protein